jgi:murein DD-endopeptidase MepM/ murein hydrolase activator NlpD
LTAPVTGRIIAAHEHLATIPVLSLLLAAFTAGQGQALELAYPREPDVVGVTVTWSGRSVPFVAVGERWSATVGVDLDSRPGDHAVDVTFRYADGHTRVHREPVVVRSQQYPTTELKVEDRYVELSPEDQARADREGAETKAIYDTFTPERLWSAPFAVPVEGAKDGRNFGHRRVFNGQPRAPHSGADLRATTGTPIHAANRGRVVLAKDLFYSGNAVFIDHGLGLFTTYLHLSRVDVKVGDLVERGQPLGLAGATGRVTGPHLHWGVRILDARVDPFSLVRLGTPGAAAP